MMDWYNDGSVGTGGWIAMILMMSLFWGGGVIFAGIMIFRGTSNSRGSRESGSVDGVAVRNPMDILDERFARGEIESDEYEARKAALIGTKR